MKSFKLLAIGFLSGIWCFIGIMSYSINMYGPFSNTMPWYKVVIGLLICIVWAVATLKESTHE